MAKLRGHDGPVTAMAVSADGRRAVSGGGDGGVRVWDLDTGKPLHTLAGGQPAAEMTLIVAAHACWSCPAWQA